MRTLIVVVLLALVLAACGDGGASSEDTAAADTAATEQPVEAMASEAETSNPKDETGLQLPAENADEATEAGTDAGTEAGTEPAAPPTPTPAPEPAGPPTEDLPGGRYVEITEIVARENSYWVTFEPFNFEPLIGSGPEDYHIHFFWDTLEPQNAGTNGPNPGEWFLYDGPAPFTGYTFADRPPDATQMCALVADANHGVTVGSGNCVTLP